MNDGTEGEKTKNGPMEDETEDEEGVVGKTKKVKEKEKERAAGSAAGILQDVIQIFFLVRRF